MRVTSPWGGALLLREFVEELVRGLPLTLPAAVAAFGLVAVLHVLVGRFEAALVLLTGLPAALAAGYGAHKMQSNDDQTSERRFFDWLVLGFIVLWTLFNLLFTSQHLYTNRDPATYNNAGAWLISHSSLQIPPPSLLNDPRLVTSSLGFTLHNGNLQAQGMHILPAFLGLAGKFVGVSGMLRVNVLLGGLALLAFYGFGRQVVRARWAALAVLIMALALPTIFLARDSYTEPLSMALLFGGLGLLILAAERRWKRSEWWLAGFVAGCAALTRIDAYLTLAALVIYGFVVLVQTRPAQRRRATSAVLAAGLGLMIPAYFGWLDVSQLSAIYYQAHHKFIMPEFKLIGALVVFGSIFTLAEWRYGLLNRLARLTEWRDRYIIIGISGLFLLLASRPAWMVGHGPNGDGVVARDFSEQTLNWIIWYVGPVVMAAGVAGLAVNTARLLREREKQWTALILALAVTGGLYLLRPNITGDQVWATRRLLPIVTPAFVILAVWSLQQLFERGMFKYRDWVFDLRIIATVLATLAAVSPLFVSYPFLLRRLYVPQLTQIQDTCAHLPTNSAVIWVGSASNFAVQPVRTICGVDSYGLTATSATLESTLTEISSKQRFPVYAGYFVPEEQGLQPPVDAKPISSISYHEIDHTYKRAPRNLITIDNSVYLERLN